MALQMDMHARLEQTMTMRLTQSQRMALEVLQLNVQALEQHILEELETNPLLEIKEEEYTPKKEDQEDNQFGEEGSEERMERDNIEAMSDFFEPYLNEDNNYQSSSSGDDDDDFDMVDHVEAEHVDFEEYLHQQIEYINPDAHLKPCIEILLTHLDDRGYINESIEEIKEINTDEKFSEEEWKAALCFIQEQLEPAGLGASDLKECLIIQTKRLGEEFSFEARILDQYFDELLHNKLDAIAQKEHCEVDKIVEVVEFFKSLEFRPASPWTEDNAGSLRPDASVKYDPPDEWNPKGKFTIELSKRGIPELVVAAGDTFKSESLNKDDKKYINDHMNSAKALQEAIRRRNETLFLIINSICQNQLAFFEEGKSALKPLQMQEIANEVEMSAATITRTVKDKVIQTDYGIFPLKYFFSMKKVKMGGGEVNDRDQILKALTDIIDNEDKKKPLSDASISKKLLDKGFKVATRTISKYRDMLSIPSSSKRKQF